MIMIIVAIIIYIIGVWFFWLGSHNNPEVSDIYKRSIPVLWPLYLAGYIICTFLFSLVVFFKAIFSDMRNTFKRGK